MGFCHSVSPSLQKMPAADHQAGMEELDFVSASEESRKHINTWVAEKIEGEDVSLLLFAVFESVLFSISSFSRPSNVKRNGFFL